jgi:O-antigen/teichoic acid export membrane protein
MDQRSEATAIADSASLDPHLKRRTHASILWTMGQAGGDQVFSFFVFVVLARLLEKSAIGTFAIAFAFFDIGRSFAMAGVMQRVARSRELTDRDLDTIFWANMFLASACAAAIILFAPAAERAFGAPQLASCLRWLSVSIVLAEAGNTHMALRLRDFGHKTLAVRSVLGGLISGVCAVVAALLGAGIWALVIQRVVRDLVFTVLAWLAYRWRPGFAVHPAGARKCLTEAVQLGLAQVVTNLSLRVTDLGIARVLGPIVLSSYRVAWRCGELIGPQFVGPFASVGMQTYSRLRDEPAQLRVAYMSVLQKCALIGMPALVGYAVAGPWIVPALFGRQWTDAGAIAPMLLPLAIPFTIGPVALSLLAAKGRVKWQRHLAAIDLVTTIVVTWIVVPYGVRALALAYSVRAVLLVPLQICLVSRVTGIGFRDHAIALSAPIGAAAAMGIAAMAMFKALDPGGLLVTGALCGAAALIYAAIIIATLPEYRRGLRRLAALG